MSPYGHALISIVLRLDADNEFEPSESERLHAEARLAEKTAGKKIVRQAELYVYGSTVESEPLPLRRTVAA